MTKDDVVRLAHESELLNEQHYGSLWLDRIERFAQSIEHNLIASYADIIHYPEHWDTAAYPTLDSALREALTWSGCSACKEHDAHGLTSS